MLQVRTSSKCCYSSIRVVNGVAEMRLYRLEGLQTMLRYLAGPHTLGSDRSGECVRASSRPVAGQADSIMVGDG